MNTLIISFLFALLSIFISNCNITSSENDDFQNKHLMDNAVPELTYDFSIEFVSTDSYFPEEIIVKFENKGDSLALNNFLFEFISERDSYWGTFEEFRFIDKPLILEKNSNINRTFKLDSLNYRSMLTNESVCFEAVKENLLLNDEFKVIGIIGDMSKAKDTFESNLTTRSNTIEYKNFTKN